MKLNFYNIILSLGLTVIASTAFSAAAAQDKQFLTIEDYSDSRFLVKNDHPNSEGEPVPRNKIGKDSLATTKVQTSRSVKMIESGKASSKNEADHNNESKEGERDDSILSFNFLYYIFQKYKLQDIVD